MNRRYVQLVNIYMSKKFDFLAGGVVHNFPLTLEWEILFWSALTVSIAIMIGATILNPLWAFYAPYLKQLDLHPPISAPIDGIFYIQNAQLGYRWDIETPLSLLFHPALSSVLAYLPAWFPEKIWFWLISIFFSVSSLILVPQLTSTLVGIDRIPAKLLPLCLLAPGGLILTTGNAEMPCLFFTLMLLLSVLRWQILWLTICSAVLAILIKPNPLYLVPVLLVYFLWGRYKHSSELQKHTLAGVFAILGTWLVWMLIVDWQTGVLGAYWKVRMTFNPGVTGTFPGYFDRLARSFIYDGDVRDQIRYSSAIIVPIVSLIIYGIIPFAGDQHRYALAAGVITMLGIALYQGNPNKILVYSVTLPSHFAAHLILILSLMRRTVFQTDSIRVTIAVLYGLYCLGMLLVFVFGTPLAWYH